MISRIEMSTSLGMLFCLFILALRCRGLTLYPYAESGGSPSGCMASLCSSSCGTNISYFCVDQNNSYANIAFSTDSYLNQSARFFFTAYPSERFGQTNLNISVNGDLKYSENRFDCPYPQAYFSFVIDSSSTNVTFHTDSDDMIIGDQDCDRETTETYIVVCETCSQLGKTCGLWNNSCDEVVDCGDCSTETKTLIPTTSSPTVAETSSVPTTETSSTTIAETSSVPTTGTNLTTATETSSTTVTETSSIPTTISSISASATVKTEHLFMIIGIVALMICTIVVIVSSWLLCHRSTKSNEVEMDEEVHNSRINHTSGSYANFDRSFMLPRNPSAEEYANFDRKFMFPQGATSEV